MMIQTKKSNDGKVLTIMMPERFNFPLHKEFRNIHDELEKEVKTLVLDLDKTLYMDSAALGMILQLKEHTDGCKGELIIKNAKGDIKAIFEIANFDKILTIE